MNEAHQRFREWLTAGAEGDPARDVAVHASVCTECRRSIAALDLLAMVNPGVASMPAEQTGRERGRLAMAGRLVGATAVLFSAAILGVGVSQLIGVSHPNSPVAQASQTAEQNVLAQTATPGASQPDALPSPAQETLTPLASPEPTALPPGATPRPSLKPAPTPFPTAVPTATPSGVPSNTPLPTDTPTPTPSPTPAPTVPGPPTLLSATPGAGVVDLAWSAPISDGGSTLTGYEIWRGAISGTETLYATVGDVLTYQDSSAPTGTYYYRVAAINVVGTGLLSNELPADTL